MNELTPEQEAWELVNEFVVACSENGCPLSAAQAAQAQQLEKWLSVRIANWMAPPAFLSEALNSGDGTYKP